MQTPNQRLLIVDDDEMFCHVLSRSLTRRGFEVVVAHDADQALALAAQHAPTMATLDLKLENSSGLKLLPDLLAVVPHCHVVVLTGYSSIATAVEAIKLGAVNYLCKPVDADDVLNAFDRSEGDPNIEVADSPPSINRITWEHIQKVLQEHDGNISATARALGMHRRTLQRKLQKRPVRR
ncbi:MULTISPECIES: response regulator transcription factor [Halomonadaceae]|jgi:two-component system response regulator RegA|uniref:Response regulator transcription factor n=1 Tax=Vreelandella janggokensis TaxID=370767 RepID=A0ABT4IS97_9GAMM|nr:MULTISPECIES: response regulator transcription factor [Halomonas]MCW4148020.1 response regulator transcription factor [Halomonas sp. 18H]MCZ0926535.1 response regulator transcription factor [Halomonas janggokensis]MCZ0929073.1 response regulator transcription factor [Halomonas janggokensis]MDR5885497.1 response regulator transcription factor [Halomonas janggokensis]QPL47935.1 response regulator transcription factor [Halomonas sp. A40-4]